MEKALAALITTIPGLLTVWVYPWIAKAMLLPYVGGVPDATFLCEKLVASFTNPPATIDPSTQVPEEAFALTMEQAVLALTGIRLTYAQLGPLLVRIGERGLADPELRPPATP